MRHLPAALLLTAFVLLIGCNAPHDNPLDPASSRYRSIPTPPDLRGRVTSVHEAHSDRDTYSVSALLEGSFTSRLDSVWISFNGRTVFGRLKFYPEFSYWQANYDASSFGASHLGNVISRPFLFFARDSSGVIYQVGPYYVWRVIEDSPTIVSPTGGEVTSPYPTLVWQPFSAIYPVSFQVEIEISPHDSVDAVIMWQSSSIPAGVNSITCQDSLPDTTYRYQWEITVLDSFDNTSVSREAAFVVSHGLPL